MTGSHHAFEHDFQTYVFACIYLDYIYVCVYVCVCRKKLVPLIHNYFITSIIILIYYLLY